MPIHPFHGQQLTLIRLEKSQSGKRLALVQHPVAGFLRLPLEWTDRSAPIIPARHEERELTIDSIRLSRLAKACAAFKNGVDKQNFTATLDSIDLGEGTQKDESKSSAVEHAFGFPETKAGGRMGDTSSQDDTQGGKSW